MAEPLGQDVKFCILADHKHGSLFFGKVKSAMPLEALKHSYLCHYHLVVCTVTVAVHCCHGKHTVAGSRTLLSDHIYQYSFHLFVL
jgi:hypothetical protein